MPTHVVPSLSRDPNPDHNDHYSAYNKPGAVLFWLRVRRLCVCGGALAGMYGGCP